MRVVEVFRSIQGETTRAGEPCAFVRLAGCPIRCAWCDTRYAWDGGREASVEDVVERVLALGQRVACVTGGEPLASPDAPVLLRALLAAGHDVVLMTSGAMPLGEVPPGVSIVADVKSPWVHEPMAPNDPRPGASPPHFLASNVKRLGRADEVKFVVRSRVEFDWACAWASSVGLFDRVRAVLVGPAFGLIDAADVAEWVLDSRLPLRLNIQVHKLLWGEGTRR